MLKIILLIYLVVINIVSFIMMGVDKSKARKGSWRISERALFVSAIIGGSIGSILGMLAFRHKTKHMSFIIGMPLILVLQIALAAVLIVYVFR